MLQNIMAVLFVLIAGNASAQTAQTEKPLMVAATSEAKQSVAYRDAIKTCGAEWKARTDKSERKGMAAWQTFRAECVVRQGYAKRK